jgi:hypothetical protein
MLFKRSNTFNQIWYKRLVCREEHLRLVGMPHDSSSPRSDIGIATVKALCWLGAVRWHKGRRIMTCESHNFVAITTAEFNFVEFIQEVEFEAFTAVTMKNIVFWDLTPWRSCEDRCFGETYRLHLQGGDR